MHGKHNNTKTKKANAPVWVNLLGSSAIRPFRSSGSSTVKEAIPKIEVKFSTASLVLSAKRFLI
jgi:hypothetical protein